MDFKDFIKTTEALVVLIGLLLTIVYGDFLAFVTAIIYILINVPSIWKWIKDRKNRI